MTGGNENEDKSVQDKIAEGMPPTPAADKRADADADDTEFEMSRDEQRELSNALEAWVENLYDRGYSPNELGVIFHGFSHRMNAARYRPHEYDRIALSLEVRRTIETWREEQDEEVPTLAIAEAVEELGRLYRDQARREVYQDDD